MCHMCVHTHVRVHFHVHMCACVWYIQVCLYMYVSVHMSVNVYARECDMHTTPHTFLRVSLLSFIIRLSFMAIAKL